MKTLMIQNNKFFDQDLEKPLFSFDVYNYIRNNMTIKIIDKKTKKDVTKPVIDQLKMSFKSR